jgi:quercetin dioxygenase-like cupin family protein
LGTHSANSTVLVPPGAGRTIRAFGDEVVIHLSGADTGGRYTLITCTTPAGGGPPPHRHTNDDEWFHVLEGRAEFFKDGSWLSAPVGSCVFTPRGVIHTFRNPGPAPLKMLIQTSPSGFEDFFAKCEKECSKPGEPDFAAILKIASDHGIQIMA